MASHLKAFNTLKAFPGLFTDMPLDERDLALIHAPAVPDVLYNKQSIMSHLFLWDDTVPVVLTGHASSPPQRINWEWDNDAACRRALAGAGQLLHGFDSSATVPRPPELRKPLMVKIKVAGTPSSGFEWGILTANGTEPGDIRIFKGPDYNCPCRGPDCHNKDVTLDGMIIRNAVASSHSLYRSSLDRVDRAWDVLLVKGVELNSPWLICAMREVAEPGGRKIYKIRQGSNGVWGSDHCTGTDGCGGSAIPMEEERSSDTPPVCTAPPGTCNCPRPDQQADVPLVFS